MAPRHLGGSQGWHPSPCSSDTDTTTSNRQHSSSSTLEHLHPCCWTLEWSGRHQTLDLSHTEGDTRGMSRARSHPAPGLCWIRAGTGAAAQPLKSLLEQEKDAQRAEHPSQGGDTPSQLPCAPNPPPEHSGDHPGATRTGEVAAGQQSWRLGTD